MSRSLCIMVLWLISWLCQASPAPVFKVTELEQHIHQAINLARQGHGVAALSLDKQLTQIARNHSQDMAEQHFFDHINLQGEDATERAKRQGWQDYKQLNEQAFVAGLSENIFQGHLYDKVETVTHNGVPIKKHYYWKTAAQIAQSVVQGWLASPLHRKNLLATRYDRQGIGVAIMDNQVFVTEDLF